MYIFINPLTDATHEVGGTELLLENGTYKVRVRDEKTKVWSVIAIFPTTYVVLIKDLIKEG